MNRAYLDLPADAGSMDSSSSRCGICLTLGLTLGPVELPLPADRHHEWLREARAIYRAEAVRLFCQRLVAKSTSLPSHLHADTFARSIEHIAAGRCKGELLGDQSVIEAARLALSNARQLMVSINAAENGPRVHGRVDPRDAAIAAMAARIAKLELELASRGDAA